MYSISQEICTRFCCALLCCGYAIVHNEFTWSNYPYSPGLLCWHWGNRQIAAVPVKLAWWLWANQSMYTTTKHSKAKTVCIFLGIYCIKTIENHDMPLWIDTVGKHHAILMIIVELINWRVNYICISNLTYAKPAYSGQPCFKIRIQIAIFTERFSLMDLETFSVKYKSNITGDKCAEECWIYYCWCWWINP